MVVLVEATHRPAALRLRQEAMGVKLGLRQAEGKAFCPVSWYLNGVLGRPNISSTTPVQQHSATRNQKPGTRNQEPQSP